MNRFFYKCSWFFFLIVFISCKRTSQYSFSEEVSNKNIHPLKDSISYTLFYTQTNTYGFDIFLNGKVFIHQPLIPFREGMNGFPTGRTAEAAAKLIVERLKNKEYSFLIHRYEIDSLVNTDNIILNSSVKKIYPLPGANTSLNIPFSKKGNSLSIRFPSLYNAPVKALWQPKGIVPFGPRGGGLSFSIGDFVYMGGGALKDETIDDFWGYNAKTNTWTCFAGMPSGDRISGISFAIKNKGYLGLGNVGGGTVNTYKKDLYEYDPAQNKWHAKTGFPGTARVDAVSFTINDKVYVGSGYDETRRGDFYEYDPSKDSWKRIADFPEGAVSSSIGITTGTKGFIVAGDRVPLNMRFTYEYVPTVDKWIKRADFPGHPRYFLSGAGIDTNFFIAGAGGAEGGAMRFRDFFLYDISKNKWSGIPDYPISKLGNSRPYSGNVEGRIFMGTGFNGIYLNDWNVFDYYFSVRKDTGMYDEGTYYPLKYNGSWELHQECTGEDCYAGISIRSKEQLGNICYASHYTTQGKELNLLNNKYFVLPRSFAIQTQKQPEQKVGIRLFFTRDELSDAMMSSYQKKTGLLFSPENIKILQCNEKNIDCSIDNNHFEKTSFQFLHPIWYQYGANGETIVAEFTTTVLHSEFYAVISSAR